MNIIYFGISIVALLISKEAYAMEGLEGRFSIKQKASAHPRSRLDPAEKGSRNLFAYLNAHHTNIKILKNLMEEQSIDIDIAHPRQGYLIQCFPKDQARMLLRSAEEADNLLKYDSALAYYVQVLNLESMHNYVLTDKQIALMFKKIAGILDKKRMPQNSLLAYQMALDQKNFDGQPALSSSDCREIQYMMKQIKNNERDQIAPQIFVPKKRKDPPSHNQRPQEDEESIDITKERIKNSLKAAGNLNLALRYCNELLNLHPPLSDSDRAEIWYLKGKVLQKLARTSKDPKKEKVNEALVCFKAALDLKDSSGFNVNLKSVLHEISECYLRLNQKGNAEKVYREFYSLLASRNSYDERREGKMRADSSQPNKMAVNFFLNETDEGPSHKKQRRETSPPKSQDLPPAKMMIEQLLNPMAEDPSYRTP